MPKSRPPYPAAIRQQMVELVRSGRKPGELAREFEPSAEAIRKWVAQADRDAGKRTDGLTTDVSPLEFERRHAAAVVDGERPVEIQPTPESEFEAEPPPTHLATGLLLEAHGGG